MVKKILHIRITERRMHKLQLYAVEKDKTMTQIIEELLDSLPEPKNQTMTASAHDAARAVNPSA